MIVLRDTIETIICTELVEVDKRGDAGYIEKMKKGMAQKIGESILANDLMNFKISNKENGKYVCRAEMYVECIKRVKVDE